MAKKRPLRIPLRERSRSLEISIGCLRPMVVRLLTLVFKTHHIVKNCHFNATSFCNRRLLEIAFCSDIANDALAIEAFLKSA